MDSKFYNSLKNQNKILIIDFGMGNLWSVESALNYLNINYETTQNYKKLFETNKIILPGVGSFRRAMQSINKLGLTNAIKDFASDKKNKILGICLGYQLLTNSSNEDGFTEGLGLINTRVEKFNTKELKGNKIPHIGFNSVFKSPRSKLFDNLPNSSDFYFVHSYKIPLDNLKGDISICNNGCDFAAAFEKDNIYGVQFHPEKSQKNGLKLLSNFLFKV